MMDKPLVEIFNAVPGYIGWKDKNSVFLGCNINNAKAVQLKHPEDIIGLTDIDLMDQTEESAQFHRAHDQIAMEGYTIKTLHSSSSHLSDNKTYFQTKKIFKQGEETIGIIYHCVEFFISTLFAKMQDIDKRYAPSVMLPLYYELESNAYNNPYQFSPRELECLFCMLRGMSAKQIGNFLGLTKRTIEFYIDNIKNKVGCSKKSQLLDIALEKGYLTYFPQQFLNSGCHVMMQVS